MEKVLIIDLANFYGGGQKYIIDISSGLKSYMELHYIVADNTLYNKLEDNKVMLNNQNYFNFLKIVNIINKYIYQNNITRVILNGNRAFYLTPWIKCSKKFVIRHLPLDAVKLHKRFLVEILTNIMYIFTSKIIFVAKYAQNEMIFLKNKGTTIYNGIDVDKYMPNRKEKNKIIVISLIARLEKHKGQYEAINVFSKLMLKYKNIQLNIIGGGKEYDNLAQLIGEKELEQYVKLLGFSNNIKDELNNSDIFILPSKQELFPITILEAMAMGLPIVSTKVAGIPEMVVHDFNGLLIDAINETQLYGALESLINNEELRERMGENSRSLVVENFSIQSTVNNLKKVILGE